jgi:endonuclease/exonuclease/phosphatase family metal-dependent hydrolase
MKILTWNTGCYFFLKYAKYFGIAYRGQKILHEYFQPIINGAFISESIEKIDADILFLQEIFFQKDIQNIPWLKQYPYQKFMHTTYHKNQILIASKTEFSQSTRNGLSIISCAGFTFIPVHLSTFHASKRLLECVLIEEISKENKNVIVLGDTNMWSRGESLLFKDDRKAYQMLTWHLRNFSRKILSTSVMGLALDKVFGSENLNVISISSPRIRGSFMDHYPIILEIEARK